MTLLEIVQHFCRRTNNLSVPSTVYGSTDPQVLQLLALLEEEGSDLAARVPWQEITYEATHTSLAAENQGAITSIATNGFSYIKQGTFWDRTEKLPIYVMDGIEWQSEKGFAATGPRYSVRIRGNRLIATPTPAAGNTWAFEYVSKNWILEDDGATYAQFFSDDDDTPLLPENLLLLGLRWRWKKEKGLEYQEDFATYERLVANAISRNGIGRALSMDNHGRPSRGLIVDQGNWPL